MAFNVIAKSTLRSFWQHHADSENALTAWYKLMSKSDFANFAVLRETFGNADFVLPDYVIFNIKGNRYRLITRINFTYKTVWIKHIFTHAEYDRWTP
ncbi:MAG: type II toxin-antitoxin system HigB family toxin [Trueperaceae bacterium]|nr:MAG: type II toxin-antitoxin system HigB family toxin [Trueperaceae bacterium]